MAKGRMVFPRPAHLIFLALLISLSSCHVVRYVWWNYADIHDCDKFPVSPVQRSDQPRPFSTSGGSVNLALPDSFITPGKSMTFESFLAEKKTVAFLIVRNDSLVYEHYFGGFSRESVLPSFSVAKSFVAALVGIAIHEGKIKSVDQPVTDFLPELADPGFQKVRIRDLLEMRSGIRFTEEYSSPFAEMSKFYYGLDLRKYTLKLRTESKPGVEYNYQSANTQLLAMVLERATGKRLPEYFGEKIWTRMGTEYPASWSLDSKRHEEARAFCCINARAIDFAKFGRLFLERGVEGNDTIIPPAWVRETLTITNDSRDSQGYPYTYHWRVTPEGDFFAKGVLGQFIYVCPAKNTVIIRFGEKSCGLDWPMFFHELTRSL